MDITSIKLDRGFVAQINKLKEKYGEEFEYLNGFHKDNLNFSSFIDNFVDTDTLADATIDPNANSSTKDITSLMSDKSKPHDKMWAYNKIYYETRKKYGVHVANEWLETEWNGGFYMHNAPTSSFKPYCFAYDLNDIAERGLFFIDKFKTAPPQHLTTFNDHTLEFVGWTSNRTSGAVGLVSYFIYSYYFWQKDVKEEFYLKNPEYYRRQCFQKFIYDLNQPYLRVTECAFTNVSIMDREYLVGTFGERQFPDGTFVIDYIEEIIEHQKVFMEVVSEIRKEQYMTFPVISYSLLFKDGKFVDEEFARWANKHNMEWYDANFFVGNDVTISSACCRMTFKADDIKSKKEKLEGFINSIGGTSLKIGSVQVNTINLRRIALECEGDKEKFMEILRQRTELCIKVLDVIRGIIVRNIEKGLLPNYTHGIVELDRQFNTIGITATYEAIRELGMVDIDKFGNHSYSEEGLNFAKGILDEINKLKDNINYDYSMSLESVPGESCNVKTCKKDSLLYGNEYEDFIYSNQWIPLMERCTIDEKIKLGSILDKECGGGQISHINLQGKFSSEEQAWELLNRIAEEGVIYFAYNVKTSVCKSGHGFFGDTCPKCGEPVYETYQRVVGFLTSYKTYSKERKQEFDKRKWFQL